MWKFIHPQEAGGKLGMSIFYEFSPARIARRLTEAKEALDPPLSDAEIAKQMVLQGSPKVTGESVRRYLKGVQWQIADRDKFFALAKVLNKDPLYLLFGIRTTSDKNVPPRVELTEQEFELLNGFRALPPAAQDKALAYLDGLHANTAKRSDNVRPFAKPPRAEKQRNE